MKNEQNLPQNPCRAIPRALRERVFSKFGHKCMSCGLDNQTVPLDLAFILPISVGGEVVEENLTLLCPNCHSVLDSAPRELEFVSFVAELLRRHPDFRSVRTEALIGREKRFRADLLAERATQTVGERLLIECTMPPLRSSRLAEVVAQMRK